jgi:hypothetical protein
MLTGIDENFPDEPIRIRREILFPTVTQRNNFDNSDGHRDVSGWPSEPWRVNCFCQLFERFAVGGRFRGLKMHFSSWTCGFDPTKMRKKISAFRWWGSRLYSVEECKFRTIQRKIADLSIWGDHTLHVENWTFSRVIFLLLGHDTLQYHTSCQR